MQDESPVNAYDEVPYPSLSYPQTHPDRLATLATLHGLRPAPVDRCRVLEIGCAGGGNLIPMAEALPDSEFVGIDLSARQLAAAGEAVRELELKNVRLGQVDLRALPAELGAFDYVIAHGVFSWVSRPVQEALLALCRRHLKPEGVAYVSYNAYPGWHSRAAVREMMQFHTSQIREPQARVAQARALMGFMAETADKGQSAYAQMIKVERQTLADKLDAYILHDELSEVNEPVYFREFAARAAAHGLQFLAEAEPNTAAQRLPRAALAALAKLGADVVAREQYLDFVTNRTFRRTLLCHAEVTVGREPMPEQVRGFQIASRAECLSPAPDLRSAKPEEFRGPTGVTAGTDHPLSKAAFVHLASVWPRSLSFEKLQAAAWSLLSAGPVVREAAALAQDTHLLAENLLQAFTAGVVELHVHTPPLVAQPGPWPQAMGWSRLQAKAGSRVTSLRHEVVPLDDISQLLLSQLDGSRDRAALLEALVRFVEDRGMVVQRHGRPIADEGERRAALAQGLELTLAMLGRSALLRD
jgi:cyclopropane fatty-acyl-phospholipid synthase-like methyltransferase